VAGASKAYSPEAVPWTISSIASASAARRASLSAAKAEGSTFTIKITAQKHASSFFIGNTSRF
jgi:hypothetical protein